MFNTILITLGIRKHHITTILQADLYEAQIGYSLMCDKCEEYKAAKAMYRERIKRLQEELDGYNNFKDYCIVN